MSIKHASPLQSAMEYLMTYGWAILIIAVVLGALFQLGIFNASTFTPKAPPGACHVFRPNGPATTSFINLQGICNGELPQYAASFNGQTSYVSIPDSSNERVTGTNSVTVSFWVKVLAQPTSYPEFISKYDGYEIYMDTVNIGVWLNIGGIRTAPIYYPYSWSEFNKNWVNLIFTRTTFGLTTIYQNSVNKASATVAGTLGDVGNPILIGAYPSPVVLNGEMANVQVYNTSLSSNEVAALYQEGIGGAPLKLNNLIGWWPLNGDTKDYSGNNNNGAATSGLSFTSSWQQGYSAP